MITSTSDYLWATAQFIRKHGWLKDKLGTHNGPRCLLGAMSTVIGTIEALRDSIKVLTEEFGMSVAKWNDQQPDKETVIAAVERVAKRLEDNG